RQGAGQPLRCRGDRERCDHYPHGGHERLLAAATAAAAAARMGKPAGTIGVRTSAIPAPPPAATIRRRPRASSNNSAMKKAGNSASRPSAFGSPSRDPIRTPTTVPSTQPMYCGMLTPAMYHGSKVPSPLLAAAQDASTVLMANAVLDHARPRSDGASATPMAR